MKFFQVFLKTLKEQSRDWLGMSLTLVFAPFFVFLYWLFFPSGSTTYGVLVLNHDVGAQIADGTHFNAGEDMIAALNGVTYANGDPLLAVKNVFDRVEAESSLRDRDAAVLLVIPADFTQTILANTQEPGLNSTSVLFVGDLTNPYYAVAAVMANSALEQYIQTATNQHRPILVTEEALGASAARSEFEIYVPGLLVFAVIMLVFLAAMSVAREVEAGTLRRLQITRMTALDYLGGISAALVLVGIVQVVLTFLAAWALGFHSQGPLWVAILIGIVTSFSVIGVGLVVASFSRTVNQAFLIANFPLVLFMFFSGAIFPLPRVSLFTLAGRNIGLYDVLPPTHAVVALNKVLTLGAGVGEVVYELGSLLVLSVIYFIIGLWLFNRSHLRGW